MRVVAMKPALLTLALAGGMSVAGCTSLKGHAGYVIDADLVNSVQPRIDNKASVQKVLGDPTFTAQFNENEWFYLSRDTKYLGFTKPKPTGQQAIRIRFDQQGTVTSVSKTGLELASNVTPYRKTTPTLGRKRSFFEQLFGNIGTVGALPGGGGGQGGPSDTP
ncbi:MAG: outer membrane protein assembly factor BamE [Sphingomonas sp.]